MNIWYIHPYAGSPKHGMSFRPYYLARNFDKVACTTTVISSLHHHLSDLKIKSPGLVDVEGVMYYLVGTPLYSGNGVKRIINMLAFGIGLFKSEFRKFSETNKPDIIIASTAHPFHIFAAKYYAKKYNAKLILEVRDIWPLSLQELVGISKFHPLSIIIDFCQKYAYKHCDYCVSLLENSEPLFIKEGLKKNSFVCISNGIELSDNSSPKDERLLSDLESKLNKFDTVIGYTGALGIPNNLAPLIEACKQLEKYNIGVLLVGDGIEKQKLITRVRELDLENVVFFGTVAKDQIQHIVSYCDAMFINAQPKELYKYGISPNKIFDYMISNKLVFNGIDSPNNPMEKAGCEIRFCASSHTDLASKIIEFHQIKPSRTIESAKFVEKEYTYEKLAAKYINLFRRLLK
ncbi:glycosyltransferase family 4 protein [Shewanella sp. SR43-8]|uniref:glycosyltransferase family 4 protein n=1 Tax=Shewanella sp. SR43-8 TaxID=2760938 RepID=UPI001601EA3C|nr:glycosyltransferase family 4 protein [Shewanella sp. SR43-8]MBB1322657.1 glycosyltransferase family 4 protein [Shewanella sp. SR43-8]